MSKTEQAMRDGLAKKGYWLGHGKRAFDVIKRLEALGRLAGHRINYTCVNVNGCQFKSQWNNPPIKLGYEVAVVTLPA